ncbi:tetratricopeptide repeat protein [Reyranella sp.]|uniref:tetratricopeptide repeat protein n=1 Tax=Reyranella sp. TaxID=1929291 RepID=UPI003D0D280C
MNKPALSGASADAREHYERALGLFRLYSGDPLAAADAALADSPGFAMAHLLKAWLNLLGTEPAGIDAARAAHATAAPHCRTAQEKGHLAAVGHLAEGRWHDASRAILRVSTDHPHDLLALQAGHQIDFFTGNARLLRDRIARALADWSADMPGYHALLGMHAFGLEEMGDYGSAEIAGRRAVELEPRDGWGQHAVAHVLEMQGRTGDGIAWMRDNADAWSCDSFFAVHNWWHLALYHLDRGETGEVLRLFDGPIFGARSGVAMDLLDAAALLWRLHLRGEAVGDRWTAVADNWQPFASAGNYAFNDAHAVMAFVGASRPERIAEVMDAQDRAMASAGDNARFTREVGRPVVLGLKAFGEGDYAGCIAAIQPVIPIANRFGGSHAQRDLLDLTVLEAALRLPDPALARAITAERRAVKPDSLHARSMFERARGLRGS